MSHAKLPPSAAHRWVNCTASVAFIEANVKLLPADGSVYADEGTKAHDLAAILLNERRRTCTADEQIEYGAEMTTCVEYYVAFVLDRVEPGDTLMVERKVPLFYSPEERGTTDAAIRKPASLYIADLKYGQGVSVQARDNKQLAIYAESLIRQLEALDDIPPETVITLAIFQPRDHNNPEPVRLWAISRAQLEEFCANIAFAARVVQVGTHVEFKADAEHQCRFCPAKGICPTYAQDSLRGLEVLPLEVDKAVDAPLPPLANLTTAQRSRILWAKKAFFAWLEGIENQVVAELMNNNVVPGWKLVEGKSNRRWVNDDQAKKLLTNHLSMEQIRPPGDVISPAQAEKELKGIPLSTKFENRFKQLIEKPAGNPTLVPLDDKRPALNFDATKSLRDLDVI